MAGSTSDTSGAGRGAFGTTKKPSVRMAGQHSPGGKAHLASGTFHGKKGSVVSRSNYEFPRGISPTNRTIKSGRGGMEGLSGKK